MEQQGKKICLTLEGYVLEADEPNMIARVRSTGSENQKFKTVIMRDMYDKFAEQGILGEDMRFQYKQYEDGSSDVLPWDPEP